MMTNQLLVQIVITIISAFFGGGLMNFIYIIYSDWKKRKAVATLLSREIWANVRCIQFMINGIVRKEDYKVAGTIFQFSKENLIILDANTARIVFEYYIRLQLLEEILRNPHDVRMANDWMGQTFAEGEKILGDKDSPLYYKYQIYTQDDINATKTQMPGFISLPK
jgi:hypothetical protein